MSAFNEAECISDAIDSILNQTFSDWEFLIVDDGSTDSTMQVLSDYAERDPRIFLIRQANIGLTKSLNRAILLSRGEYIARQDADDISMPERLEKQVKELNANPGIVLVGSAYSIRYRNKKACTEKKIESIPPDKVKIILPSRNPFAHSSVMYRREPFIKAGLYDTRYRTSQDYDAWLRLEEFGRMKMLPDFLVRIQVRKKSISKKQKLRQGMDSLLIRLKYHKKGYFRALWDSLIQFFCAFLKR